MGIVNIALLCLDLLDSAVHVVYNCVKFIVTV